MQPIQRIRDVLRQWAEKEKEKEKGKVEVLPAAGGALEELQRPDIEEVDDRLWGTEENIHDTVWERLPDGERIDPKCPYHPTPPCSRREHFHILRPLPKQIAYPLNRLHHRLLMRIILPITLYSVSSLYLALLVGLARCSATASKPSVSSLYLALLEYQLSSLICSRS